MGKVICDKAKSGLCGNEFCSCRIIHDYDDNCDHRCADYPTAKCVPVSDIENLQFVKINKVICDKAKSGECDDYGCCHFKEHLRDEECDIRCTEYNSDCISIDILPEWQFRVIEEQQQLQGRLDRLRNFMSTETFKKISLMDQTLLVQQSVAMDSYLNILFIRIQNF